MHDVFMQVYWSFDEAHPALAAEHCLRTAKQSEAIAAARAAACAKAELASREAAAHARRLSLTQSHSRSRPSSRRGRTPGHHSAEGHGDASNGRSDGEVAGPGRPASAPVATRSRRRPLPANVGAAQRAAAKLSKQCDDVERRASAAIARAAQLTKSETWLQTDHAAPSACPDFRARHRSADGNAAAPSLIDVTRASAEALRVQQACTGDETHAEVTTPRASTEVLPEAGHATAFFAMHEADSGSLASAQPRWGPLSDEETTAAEHQPGRHRQEQLRQEPVGAAVGMQAASEGDESGEEGQQDVALGRFTGGRYAAYEQQLAREMAARRGAGGAQHEPESGVGYTAACCAVVGVPNAVQRLRLLWMMRRSVLQVAPHENARVGQVSMTLSSLRSVYRSLPQTLCVCRL